MIALPLDTLHTLGATLMVVGSLAALAALMAWVYMCEPATFGQRCGRGLLGLATMGGAATLIAWGSALLLL